MALREMIRAETTPRLAGQAMGARVGERALPWQRFALGAVLLLAAGLDFWDLTRIGYGNTYYAAAVRSMLQSWHAFFYNAFDPAGFVSIDKPPLGFWFQVASAKLFSYSGLSLMLPQALAGVLSVAVLYRLVARTFGCGAGLLAALALAVMPVSVAANRTNIIDSTLVLFLLLGAWAVLRAAETGRLRWLLLSGVLIGLGFNIKMLEAFLVVPAFGLMYLVGAPLRWTTRLWHLSVATVVLLAVALSWAVAVDATPAAQRPYVGSSGTNSELNLAFGYNGLERLTGRIFGGARSGRAPTAPAANASAAVPGAGGTSGTGRANTGGFTRGESGAPGPLRLFDTALGGQVSWLLPLALLGLLAAAGRTRLRLRPRLRLDRQQQALVLWGAWLVTTAAFFSVAGFFHAYYMVTMAPAIAALAGIGLVALWHDYRGATWQGWALPLVLLVTVSVQVYLLAAYPSWSAWLSPLVLGLAIVAALALVLLRLGVSLGRAAGLVAAALGVVAVLAAPTVWAAETVATGGGGGTPTAGPRAQTGTGGFRGAGFAGRGPWSGTFGEHGGFGTGSNTGGGGFGAGGSAGAGGFGRSGFGGPERATANSLLVRYLEQHQGTATYLAATPNAMTAAPLIIQTGKAVLAWGGFSGADQILSPSQFAALVAKGTVHYVLLSSFGFGGAGRGGNAALTQWVIAHGTVVPASQYGASTTDGVGQPQLYYVSSVAASR